MIFLLGMIHYSIILLKKKLIERTFKSEETLYLLPVAIKRLVLTSTDHRRYKLWSGQKVCYALSYLLNNIYIRF